MKPQPVFDSYASTYDQDFTFSEIGKLQRAQVWNYLNPYLQSPKQILEINCGTGYDAIKLGKAGHQVVATDFSSEMILQGQKKLKQHPGSLEVHFQQAGFLELQNQFKGQQFDLIFSNFGGLNCLSPEDTKQLAAIFHKLLSSNGLLFLVYMSSACLWERLYYTFKGQKLKAQRRKSVAPTLAKVANKEIPIWYYSPRILKAIFAKKFQVIQVKPIGFFVPPSYLEHYFKHKNAWLKTFNQMDHLFSASLFANYADHFAIVLQKNLGDV